MLVSRTTIIISDTGVATLVALSNKNESCSLKFIDVKKFSIVQNFEAVLSESALCIFLAEDNDTLIVQVKSNFTSG